MKKKGLAIGVENFKAIIDGNSYYVDKTSFIKELLDKSSSGGVRLFLRPRRFGKTLALSTLRYFLDIEEKDNAYLFKNLEIAKDLELCEKYQNKAPVIFFTLKGVNGNKEESFLNSFNKILYTEYERHSYVKEVLSEGELLTFNRIQNREGTADDFTEYLSLLEKGLYDYYGIKPIVLIDEYDVPLNTAHYSGCFEFVVDIIKEMFSNGLKTNDNLEFAVITGCLQIAKNQIFTGLNNPGIYPVTDTLYTNSFGFTKEETKELLSYYNLDNRFKDVVDNYDGYHIGKWEIFNPHSLLNFVSRAVEDDSFHCKNYWVTTSGNAILKEMLIASLEDAELKQIFETLISGECAKVKIDSSITYNTMTESNSAIMGTLLYSGYLTTIESFEDDFYNVKIPNKEVLTCFINLVEELNKSKVEEKTPIFIKALLDKDTVSAKQYLNKLYESILKVRDKTSKENNYHYFLAAILALNPIKGWRFISQAESIDGYSDFVLDGDDNVIIIEEKVVSTPKAIETETKKAFKQIEDRNYALEYETLKVSNILKYAIIYYNHRAYITLGDE